MAYIKKIKVQDIEYELRDANALHDGDEGTANVTVSKAINADNANNANTVNNHTVQTDVPSDAVFTDTITTNVIVSATQPTGQNAGDFWYKTV